MASPNTTPYFDTKPTYGLTNTANPTDQAIARQALRDLMLFNNAVQAELQKMRKQARQGILIDTVLFEKMLRVQNRYDYAMTGFKAFDDDMERNALDALAEAIEDLTKYIQDRSH